MQDHSLDKFRISSLEIALSLPSPRSQRKYICSAISELTHQETVDVYKFLSARTPKNVPFKANNNGCSINLDKLSNELIAQLYNCVLDKTGTILQDCDQQPSVHDNE